MSSFPRLVCSLFIAITLCSVGGLATELCFDAVPSSCPAIYCELPSQPDLDNCRRYKSKITAAEQQISDIERLFVPVLNIAVNGAQSPADATGNVTYQLSLVEFPDAAGASSDGIERSMSKLEQKTMGEIAAKNGINVSDPYQALRPMEQSRLDEVQDGLQDLHTRNKQLIAALKGEQSSCPTKNKALTDEYDAGIGTMNGCEEIYSTCLTHWANFVEEFSSIYILPFERSGQTCVKY